MHYFNVSEADEAENGAKIRFLKIERLSRTIRIHASTRKYEYDVLALECSLRPLLRVGNRASDAHHMIYPRLECRRRAEVVHGVREHNNVGLEQLINQHIG